MKSARKAEDEGRHKRQHASEQQGAEPSTFDILPIEEEEEAKAKRPYFLTKARSIDTADTFSLAVERQTSPPGPLKLTLTSVGCSPAAGKLRAGHRTGLHSPRRWHEHSHCPRSPRARPQKGLGSPRQPAPTLGTQMRWGSAKNLFLSLPKAFSLTSSPRHKPALSPTHRLSAKQRDLLFLSASRGPSQTQTQVQHQTAGNVHRLVFPFGSLNPHYNHFRCTATEELPSAREHNDSTLKDYWLTKDSIEQKYQQLLERLELEEASEIKHYASKYVHQGSQNEAKEVVEIIRKVRENYDVTRRLLLSQKLVEQEEIILSFPFICEHAVASYGL